MDASAIVMMLFFLFTPDAPYGQPAPGAKVFKHVPEGAVVVMGLDAASLAQGMEKKLDKLLAAPLLKKSKAMQPVVQALNMGRGMMKAQAQTIGIDPFRDVRYVMLAFQPGPDSERGIIVAGGKFPGDILAKVGKLAGKEPEGDILQLESDGFLARHKDGSLVFGNKEWVQMALDGKHKNKAMKPLLRDYDRKTWLMVAFRPDETIRRDWKNEDAMARPILDHIEGLSLRMTYGGEVIKVVATDRKFVDVYKGLLDGFGQMSAASHQFATGALDSAEGFLASLDPVSALGAEMGPVESAIVSTLVENRKEIRKLIKDLILGKKVSARVKANKARRTAELTIKGRGPSTMMFLGGVVGWLTLSGADAGPMVEEKVEAVPAEPMPVPPAKGN
jgi:hypothetical protein